MEAKLMAFSNAWTALQNSLAAETSIANWTADKGLLGDHFTVVAMDSSFIEVDTPNAKNLQRVPRWDSEFVYKNWVGYTAGKIPRHVLRDGTRFSKYAISILHWLESQLGGSLP
jgi:hypothetical protein